MVVGDEDYLFAKYYQSSELNIDKLILKVRDLKIGATVYPPNGKPHDIEIVHGVSFDLERGRVLGLIGESGAGKSTIGLSAMAYGRGGVEITGGGVWKQTSGDG